MNFRSEKAVTLIALVVSVLVLLILAGVTITAAIGDHDKDLISKTYSSKELAEVAQDLEESEIDSLYGYGIIKPDDDLLGNDNEVLDSEDDDSTDVTEEEETVSGNLIPSGGVYTQADGTVLEEGDYFPDTVTTGDQYTYGDYIYAYNQYYNTSSWSTDETQNGWGVRVQDKNEENFGIILSTINGKPITSMNDTFYCCYYIESFEDGFTIPEFVTSMDGTFYKAGVKTFPSGFTIPDSVTNMYYAFYDCDELTSLPEGFKLSDNVTNLDYAFYNCALTSLPSSFYVPASATKINGMFMYCQSLTGTITINTNTTNYSNIFFFTSKTIKLTGSSTKLSTIASSYSNVSVLSS